MLNYPTRNGFEILDWYLTLVCTTKEFLELVNQITGIVGPEIQEPLHIPSPAEGR